MVDFKYLKKNSRRFAEIATPSINYEIGGGYHETFSTLQALPQTIHSSAKPFKDICPNYIRYSPQNTENSSFADTKIRIPSLHLKIVPANSTALDMKLFCDIRNASNR